MVGGSDKVMSTEINTGSLTEIDGFYMDTVICDRVYDASEGFGDPDVNGSIEIGLVVSGAGVYRVVNQMIPCQEGDVYILNEHVPHRCYSSEPGTPLTIRRIIFSPKEWLFSKYASSTEPAFLYGCFRENNVMAYAMLTQAVHETVGRLYDEIAIELFDRKAEWKEAIRARLVLLLISASIASIISSFSFSVNCFENTPFSRYGLKIISQREFTISSVTLVPSAYLSFNISLKNPKMWY
jgi:hypothetical protein